MFTSKGFSVIFTIAVIIRQIHSVPLYTAENLKFIIIHNNDLHARFEQVSKYATICTPEESERDQCYGGFARIAHEVRKYREDANNGGPPVLYLNAGDTYTGTPWFTIYRDNITASFLNILSPDAMSLGNHEFDEGLENLVQFLDEINFPVVTSNVIKNNSVFENSQRLQASTILEVSGNKIGVIGYLTPDTKNLTRNCNVHFTDEIQAINAEAKILKEGGVKIIIALGHSGYQKDQEIARNCLDVDIVIGGHSHSFLYTGNPYSNTETIEGPYPTIVKNLNGKEVPVVQAYAFSKYLGKLEVEFDSNGNLVHWIGAPILLNASIPQDPDVLQLLEMYRPKITSLEMNIIGYTRVPLQGADNICRKQECNLGNLIADSLVYTALKGLNQSAINNYWTDSAIGLIQGGGVRASIDKRTDGSITLSDVITTMPFQSIIVKLTMKGSILRQALQHSADVWDKDSNGGFLQVSGLRVLYNMSQPVGERLQYVQVLCANCSIPKYSNLTDDKIYNVIMSEFLADGGDGFDFKNIEGRESLNLKDNEFLVQYIKDKTLVYPGIDERIIIIQEKVKGISSKTGVSLILLSLSLFHIFLT